MLVASPGASAESRQRPINLDLVIPLTGELGNHLSKIAYGKILQLMALEDGRFNFTLRYLSEGLSRSETARQDVQNCFSRYFASDEVNMAEWNAKSEEWNEVTNKQASFVSRFHPDPSLAGTNSTLSIKGATIETIHSSFDHLENLANEMTAQGYTVGKLPFPESSSNNTSSKLSSPFVVADSSVFFPMILLDRYFDDLYELFTFNDEQCCATRLDADEAVLHFRGYFIEEPGFRNNPKRWRMRELNPNQTAFELFGHLNTGDKVAIMSRFGEEHMQPYVDAMKERGLKVRVVTGQTGVQDFCFLKSSTKEIVGTRKSTYFGWAALLSDTVKRVTAYSIDFPFFKDRTAFLFGYTEGQEFENTRLRQKSFHLPVVVEYSPPPPLLE